MEEGCIFKHNKQSICKGEGNAGFSSITYGGINIIIKCSRKRHDTLHLTLISQKNDIEQRELSNYQCHKSRKATYISKTHIRRYATSNISEPNDTPPNRTLRSSIDTPTFVWKQHCVFCGEHCDVHHDKKNPNRWHAAYESDEVRMNVKKRKLDVEEDKPFKNVLNDMEQENLDRMWTSYKDKSRKFLSRKKLVDSVLDYFGEK